MTYEKNIDILLRCWEKLNILCFKLEVLYELWRKINGIIFVMKEAYISKEIKGKDRKY